MTGDFIDAETALARGLLNRVVDEDALDDAVADLCARIIRHPPVAVETGKRMFYQQIEMPLAQAYELAATTMACNMMAEDTLEGVQAFIDKRPPKWEHRD
ncbi:MAG: enoyl-CoA hydratase, partial [Gammaproteobacteria bacterium]|nr:enoyl-CoA hydratase [Gammaproteobacteria bacterium]